MTKRPFILPMLLVLAGLSSGQRTSSAAEEQAGIGNADIGGTVSSRFGREAGVWVIAETKELGTRYAKVVVTDDRGQFVVPDLPKANYQVWVRGYGLVDSPKYWTQPGKLLNVEAVIAPTPAEAAQYYPAIYWFSMLKAPDPSNFPGTGP